MRRNRLTASQRLRNLTLGTAAFTTTMGLATASFAGDFDARGIYHPDAEAAVFMAFDEAPTRVFVEDGPTGCWPLGFRVTGLGVEWEDEEEPEHETALIGSRFLHVNPVGDCPERFSLPVKSIAASYEASVWARHGALSARVVVEYPEESGIPTTVARLSPTGRVTSDGWVEHASNAFAVDGAQASRVYMRIRPYADDQGVDIDALELRLAGPYVDRPTCAGVRDPVCGPGWLCINERCVNPENALPPLPQGELKNDMVDAFASKLDLFYGGRETREKYLPIALETIEEMREADTAYDYWNGLGLAVRQLHDWHTSASVSLSSVDYSNGKRLNVCFIEGDADLTADAWPSDETYKDILVSHVGGDDTAGLRPGDRLVAVDGVHPIAWSLSLIDVDWNYQTATDEDVFADHVQSLGGPFWLGGANILKYAKSFSVLRCDENGVCDETPELIEVASLVGGGESDSVACDNRPLYHLEEGANPDPLNHYIGGGYGPDVMSFYRGRVADTDVSEEIYGMVWNSLYGGGDSGSTVNSNILQAIEDWKATARGVILDHRTGNGGTLDAPSNLTRLVRPPDVASIQLMPMPVAGWNGPADDEGGLALFAQYMDDPSFAYPVGDDAYDPDLPVALLLHRSGSASDYLPYGMKGQPKTRLFAYGPTQGAFSTFVTYSYHGLYLSLASGETIGADGAALIGEGVAPDEIVLLKQSDLVMGIDTTWEAALAWVRQELKP